MADPHRSLIRRSSGQDVSAWLSHAHQVFEGLSTEDRFRTLVSFMDVCSAEERWRWQRELTDRFHRDLISWLPVELAVNILGYLDLGSLLNAAQVNRIWQSRADSHHELWRQHGDESGVRSPSAVESVRDWKSALRTAIKVRRELRVGRAFDHHVISDIPLFNGYFTALDFDQGFLAAASVDNSDPCGINNAFAIVWSLKRQEIVHKLSLAQPQARASVVKLMMPMYLCVGFVDGSIHYWDIPDSNSVRFAGHTAAIFSLAGNLELNLLVSGSGDSTVRLWNLATGTSIRTLSSQQNWVVTVLLSIGPMSSNASRSKRNHRLFTMSKSHIHCFEWKSEAELHYMQEPYLIIPLKQNEGYEELRDEFFTPGLHFDPQNAVLSFVRQMLIFETQTIGDADIISVCAETGAIKRSIHINQKIRKLLSVGRRFALVLLPYVDNKYKNLGIIDLESRKLIGGATVTHSSIEKTAQIEVAQNVHGQLDREPTDEITVESVGELTLPSPSLLGRADVHKGHEGAESVLSGQSFKDLMGVAQPGRHILTRRPPDERPVGISHDGG
eukprot:maker-scaffold742_size103727-snap-gene-0.17 protein:Tk09076 transcript:maker-scaffold742_size103727-snap-gene-0.17-mRNA-1 annotation:"f-box wd repeat-containing protein 2"